MDLLKVLIGPDLTIWGRRPPSGRGFGIDRDGIEGLDDGIAVRSDTIARTNAHGDYDVPGFLEARLVPISGTCIATSPEELAEFGSLFTGAFANFAVPVSFDSPGRHLSGIARLTPGASPKFKVDSWSLSSPRPHAKFAVQMKFNDPRLYGESHVFPGPEGSLSDVHHGGNFASEPTMRVTGSMPSGYTITGPAGKTYVVTRPLVAGSPHVIDMSTGYLSINDEIKLGGVARASLWTIPGGASVLHTLTGAGAGSLEVLVSDAFV